LTFWDEKLTNPLSNDGNLTQRVHAERNNQTRPERTSETDIGRPNLAKDNDTANVDRAQQRLTQEAGQAQQSGPTSSDQASRLASDIRDQIISDPRGALRSMNLVSDTLFEAATARPTG
jgi:hypothetical protein